MHYTNRHLLLLTYFEIEMSDAVRTIHEEYFLWPVALPDANQGSNTLPHSFFIH